MDFLAQLQQQLDLRPDQMALVDEGAGLSYAELDQKSSALATHYKAIGVKPGDVVGCLKRSMTTVCLNALAAIKGGTVHIAVDDRETPARISQVFDKARPVRVLVDTEEAAEQARTLGFDPILPSDVDWKQSAFAQPDLPDSAPVVYEATSGSTGEAKITVTTRAFLQHLITAQTDAARLTEQDRIGLMGELWVDTLLCGLTRGATYFSYDLRGAGVAPLEDWMRSNQITAIQTYVAAFRALTEAVTTPLPDLRIIRLAGEVILPRDVEAFGALCQPGAVLKNYYGATECGFMAQYEHAHDAPLPTGPLPIGHPIPGTELQVVDEARRPVPAGVTGLLLHKSPHLPLGYLGDDTLTARIYWTDGPMRVLNTGDLAVQEQDGSFRIVGRADDQVKIRGYAVRYSEVEAVLEKHPSVAQVVVTSFVSPRGQRQLSAHIIPHDGNEIDAKALKAWLAETLPAYMVPTYFTPHSDFPRTDSGKILRRALPNPLEALQAAGGAPSELTQTERVVSQVWTQVLGHDGFSPDEDFFDVGGDSLQAMSMIVDLEQQMQVRIGYESLIMQGATVRDIAERIDRAADLADQVVTLQKGDGKVPVYVMPVENGEFSDWLYARQYFSDDVTLLGVHARDHRQRASFDKQSINDMARVAADRITQQSLGGPICIAGFSAGTQLALEVTRLLQADQMDVAGLVLIDPPVAKLESEYKSWHMRRILSPLVKQGNPLRAAARAAHILAGRPTSELQIADETAFWLHAETALPKPVPTLVVWAEDEPADNRRERQTYWHALLGGSPTYTLCPGHHNSVLRMPNAPILAHLVETWWRARRADAIGGTLVSAITANSNGPVPGQAKSQTRNRFNR